MSSHQKFKKSDGVALRGFSCNAEQNFYLLMNACFCFNIASLYVSISVCCFLCWMSLLRSWKSGLEN